MKVHNIVKALNEIAGRAGLMKVLDIIEAFVLNLPSAIGDGKCVNPGWRSYSPML